MKRRKTEVSLKGTAWIEFHKFSCFLTIHPIPQDKVNAKNEKADIIEDVLKIWSQNFQAKHFYCARVYSI